jgi:hypothetical protein
MTFLGNQLEHHDLNVKDAKTNDEAGPKKRINGRKVRK